MPMRLMNVLLAALFLACACQGQSRDKLMLQGEALVGQGNHKGAIVVFKNLLERHPGDLPAALALADACIVTGKPAQAEAELAALGEKAFADPATPVLLARIRIAQARPAEALDILKPALGPTPPAGAAALEQAGHACLLLGDFKEAQAFYTASLALNPASSRAWLGLAESRFQTREPAQARAAVDALLKAHPADKAGLLMLAQLQALDGEQDAVLETFARLVKHHPSDANLVYREALLRLSRHNDVAHAAAVSGALVQGAPKAPEGHKLKGLVALAQNQPAQALEPLLYALKLRQDIDANLFLAQAYAAMDTLETAVSHLQAALARNPDLGSARRMLASIYLRQNRLDEAIAETQKLFVQAPADEAGQRILGEALVAKQEYALGLDVFSRMAEGGSASPAVYLKRALLLAIRDGDDARVEDDLRKAVQLGGKALEPRLYLASYLAAKNRVDEAVAVLGENQDDGPASALAANAMAKLRVRQGRMEDATALLEQARKADPSVLTTYYNLAAIRTATNAMDKAAEEFEAALAVNPDDPRSLMGAAGCREALGQHDKARAHLERLAKGKDPKASLALAEYLVRRADNARALFVLDEALSAAPRAVPLWQLKSRLHAGAGDQEKALAALARVETLNQNLGLLERAKYHLSRKEPDKAVAVAARLRDLKPASGDHHLPLAEVQELAGDQSGARSTLETALAADPANIRVLAALARSENRSGQTAKALDYLNRAQQAGLEPASAHTLKGAILQQAGDNARAAAEYELALRIQERHALALNNLAMIYADGADTAPKALDLALRAYTLESGNASVLDTLGYALLRNGRPQEALAALERAEKLGPGNADIAQHIALARDLAGKEKQQ